MANHYDVPSWAGKPPTGYHLDVTKDDKLIQKLMIDEKKCYLFGRNAQLNDFCIDHQSCSRVHAAFVYHKHLHICYLVDLGSTHGTFIGNIRLEAHKPTQLHMNSQFHFGASTRIYVLRERPSAGSRPNIMEDIPMSEGTEGALLGLPETQNELDNLTEYNTATNRRISMLGISSAADDAALRTPTDKSSRKRSLKMVTFNEEEIVINPEDIDPSVGRFRNLIQSTVVVPSKRAKLDMGLGGSTAATVSSIGSAALSLSQPLPSYSASQSELLMKQFNASLVPHLYQGLPPEVGSAKHNDIEMTTAGSGLSIGSKMGLLLPNPAPEVSPLTAADMMSTEPMSAGTLQATTAVSIATAVAMDDERIDDEVAGDEPKKKKYAKEAWPGRKPLLSGL